MTEKERERERERERETSTTQVITPRPPQPQNSSSQIQPNYDERKRKIQRLLAKTNKIPELTRNVCITKQTVHRGKQLDHSVLYKTDKNTN